MTLPILIAGIILWAAGSDWFSGATTVGQILTGFGAAGLVLQLIALAFAARRVAKQDSFTRAGSGRL